MTWFIDKIELLGSPTAVFTTVDIFTVLIISTVLCFIAAMTYKKTHDGVSYSPSFVQTTIIFGVLVSMIMLIIGSNIARAFTLMGALSIIRFRNAIKETRDVGFIFFMMTIGMAVGTRFFLLAFIMTLFVCLLVIGMKVFNFASQKNNDEILKIIVADNEEYEKKFETIFVTFFDHQKLLNIEQLESRNEVELTYLIRFKKTAKKQDFMRNIKKLSPEAKVSLFGTEHLVY